LEKISRNGDEKMSTKMITMHPSKAILNALNDHEISLYKQGFFPEVNYQENKKCGFNSTSFNLFERQDVSRLLFKCLNFSMIKAGIEYGAFSRKHGDKFIAEIKSQIIDQMKPVISNWMMRVECQGHPIKLWGIEDKFSFREGTISEKIYMDDIIWDFACEETNGYFAETGSAYIWEIAMIEIGSVWRPFHLSVEEKEMKKKIYA
jgi:hypothetical protein